MNTPLWTPSPTAIANSNLTQFREWVNQHRQLSLPTYTALYDWSVSHTADFWESFWQYANINASTPYQTVLSNAQQMPGASWFEGSQLNYAEHLLRCKENKTALHFQGEDRVQRCLSYAELFDAVAKVANQLRAVGVTKGDRVAGFLPNLPETIIAMLATTSLGAVWSSCSPDFGTQGVLDRFSQISPKVLFAVDGYYYNGKTIDCLDKVSVISHALPSVSHLILVPYVGTAALGVETAPTQQTQQWNDLLQGETPALAFTPCAFNDPLFIMYSSGTTGVPKCIVHSVGGTLIQHLKEHLLHGDLKPNDTLFFFTTCGWMMWNWLVTGLATGATLALYDGSPFYPSADVLWQYAERVGFTTFGTSAKYLSALEKSGYQPREHYPLHALKAICSTGSPLLPESYDFVYHHIKSDVRLSSMSGGTDILSCFALGNPILPVYRSALQCRGLGMAVEIWNDDGQPIKGEKGELVCTKPFPSMPIGFWNDQDGSKYQHAYFDRFPNIWCHGDYAELTEEDGLIIYGRSDTVLNPGGVRIGTAEIYRQVETFPEVMESMAVGQQWDGDERVILFVRMQPGQHLDDTLRKRICQQIRSGASPRHVPAKLIEVSDLPRTISGKIVELAVRNVIHGLAVKNTDSLANPEALTLFENLTALQEN
ncbi:acetoacetate--CoA ligase [Leeia sp. TBRC 13508]|uniref:Acetoacetate--CoA ligase n=1 Tax=Leeia speluncae TaxID=2884804 RepID=A0ABS8D3B4_9NEIS|nr:acetoacetate--CoA ligase [Leeia speluncae]MCB6182686.1 acetoacetate--CoA ligase [Leeia speluncae]